MVDETPTQQTYDDASLLKILLLIGGVFFLFAGALQFLWPGIDANLAGVAPGGLDWPYRMLGGGYTSNT